MPEFDFTGLRDDTQAAFKPHFTDVVRRAARRRTRTRAAGTALAAVATVGMTGAAVAVLPGSIGGAPVAQPGTSDGPSAPSSGGPSAPPSGSPSSTAVPFHRAGLARPMFAGDLDHLYQPYYECLGQDCTNKLAMSSNRGRTWRKLALPVSSTRTSFAAYGSKIIVAGYVEGSTETLQTSTDGGSTWRKITTQTVTAIPAGWGILTSMGNRPPIRAVNPATGDIAQLADRPELAAVRITAGLRPEAGLWLTGPVRTHSTGSFVKVSHDGGRSWRHHDFPDSTNAVVATYDGTTAYALVGGAGKIVVHRTTDGGTSWQPTGAELPLADSLLRYAGVRPDGALTVELPGGMRRSTDGGVTFHEAPAGPGADAYAIAGGYAQASRENYTDGVWLSPDGHQWTQVTPPTLP